MAKALREKDYGNRLRKVEWEIRPLNFEVGREIIAKYHYAGGASTAVVYCHGLFKRDSIWERDCEGVAWWLPPMVSSAKWAYPKNPKGVLALSRLVIVPGVPKNACTFLLAGSMKRIDRCVWPCLLTYADTWQNHTGGIYLAANWKYRGLTIPTEVWTRGGKVVSKKSTINFTTKQMLESGCKLEGKFPKHRYVHIIK
jgi:hypothetical protein